MLQQSCHMFCSVQIHALGSIALSYNIVNDRVFQRERLLKTGRNLHPMSITSPFQPTNAYAVQVRTPYCRVSPVNGHIESTQRAWEMRHHPEDGRRVALLLLCKRRISGSQGPARVILVLVWWLGVSLRMSLSTQRRKSTNLHQVNHQVKSRLISYVQVNFTKRHIRLNVNKKGMCFLKWRIT